MFILKRLDKLACLVSWQMAVTQANFQRSVAMSIGYPGIVIRILARNIIFIIRQFNLPIKKIRSRNKQSLR